MEDVPLNEEWAEKESESTVLLGIQRAIPQKSSFMIGLQLISVVSHSPLVVQIGLCPKLRRALYPIFHIPNTPVAAGVAQTIVSFLSILPPSIWSLRGGHVKANPNSNCGGA
jgi:hypothetical protein